MVQHLKQKTLLAYVVMSNGAIVNKKNNGKLLCNGYLPSTNINRVDFYLRQYCCNTPCYICKLSKYLDRIYDNKTIKGV